MVRRRQDGEQVWRSGPKREQMLRPVSRHNVVLQSVKASSFRPNADLELLRLFDPELIPADVKAQLGSDLHVRHCSALSEHLTPRRCVL